MSLILTGVDNVLKPLIFVCVLTHTLNTCASCPYTYYMGTPLELNQLLGIPALPARRLALEILV